MGLEVRYFIVLHVLNVKFYYCFRICVHNLSCILVSIGIYECLYSSESAFVWIHLKFGVEGITRYHEMDSQEAEYRNRGLG